jgi:hypothetical protein
LSKRLNKSKRESLALRVSASQPSNNLMTLALPFALRMAISKGSRSPLLKTEQLVRLALQEQRVSLALQEALAEMESRAWTVATVFPAPLEHQ